MNARLTLLLLLTACTGVHVADDVAGVDAGGDAACAADGVAVSRTLVVQPLGLRTQPGKHGMPPGAMSRALNVCMRDPNVVSSLPDVRSYRDDVISSGYTLRRLIPASSSVLAIGNSGSTWAARWVTGSASSTISAPSGYTLSFGVGRAQAAFARGRMFLTTEIGVQAFVESDANMRHAGFPPPVILISSQLVGGGVSYTSTNAGAVENNTVVAYKALIRRKASDGYETIGAVSAAALHDNQAGATVNPYVGVRWLAAHGVATGDVIEVYRTDAVATGSTPGDTYRLAATGTVDGTDVSNSYKVIEDNATEDALGVELYTNPGDATAGPNKSKFPPPYASDAVTFKGHTFYLGTSTPASKTLHIPSVFGLLDTDYKRAHGIGYRSITCTTSMGSPTVSAVSASDLIGVVAGQEVSSSRFADGTKVLSVNTGAGTITMTANASAGGAGHTVVLTDVIELDGDSTPGVPDLYGLQEHTVGSGLTVITGEQVSFDPAFDTDGAQFAIAQPRYADGSFTIRATNGANYSPKLPEINATVETVSAESQGNRFHWSESEQPEAVPLQNYGFAGRGTIYRGIATRDCIYVFASDGLHRISGADGVWRVDPVDPNLILAHRNAVDVLGDVVWAYTNRGLVSVSGDQVTEHTTGTIGDLVPGQAYSDEGWSPFLACDELHREVWLTFVGVSTSTSYVFNALTDSFVTVDDDEWSAMAYSRTLQSLVIGAVSSNPDVLYFEADTSATRMPGAEVRFQPFTAGDPFSLKEFYEVEFLFEGMTDAATLVPSFDGTSYTAVTVPASTIESKKAVAVPRNAPAVGRRLAPGFTLSSGGTAQKWSFRGLGVSYDVVAEESGR